MKLPFIFSLIVSLAACQSVPALDRDGGYPASWPPIAVSRSCLDLSGRYESRATSEAKIPSSPGAPTSGELLASLLRDGTSGKTYGYDAYLKFVEIDVSKMKANLNSRVSDEIEILGLAPTWRCVSGQVFQASFDHESACETCVNTRFKSLLTLDKASDGSLIVHGISHFSGFLAQSQHEGRWYRFLPLNK